METIIRVINDLLIGNKQNYQISFQTPYNKGYLDGYHDALVDLMNKLGIPHNEQYKNQ